ncbi:MAG: hypothetical protein IPJ85_00750 [Flavobacteriales bacterium]|nr:hypothetical protein [Flavobacteriales bacterium]
MREQTCASKHARASGRKHTREQARDTMVFHLRNSDSTREHAQRWNSAVPFSSEEVLGHGEAVRTRMPGAASFGRCAAYIAW